MLSYKIYIFLLTLGIDDGIKTTNTSIYFKNKLIFLNFTFIKKSLI